MLGQTAESNSHVRPDSGTNFNSRPVSGIELTVNLRRVVPLDQRISLTQQESCMTILLLEAHLGNTPDMIRLTIEGASFQKQRSGSPTLRILPEPSQDNQSCPRRPFKTAPDV